jgi:hypothetical protein
MGKEYAVSAKVFALMLISGMAEGGAADQLNLYLNPAAPGAFDAAVIGTGGQTPAADEADLRSASLDQPVRR